MSEKMFSGEKTEIFLKCIFAQKSNCKWNQNITKSNKKKQSICYKKTYIFISPGLDLDL